MWLENQRKLFQRWEDVWSDAWFERRGGNNYKMIDGIKLEQNGMYLEAELFSFFFLKMIEKLKNMSGDTSSRLKRLFKHHHGWIKNRGINVN